MSTSLLERLTVLDVPAVVCPDPRCAAPARIEDRWTLESTGGPVDVAAVYLFEEDAAARP